MTRPPLRTSLFAACVLFGVTAHAGPDTPVPVPKYVIATTSATRVKAVLSVDVQGPKIQADEWSAFAAQLTKLPGQVNVRTILRPRGKLARELSEDGRPVLYERLAPVAPQGRQNLSVRLEYEATLLARQLERREPDDPAAPPIVPPDLKTRRRELASAHQFDYKSAPFQAWLDDQKLRRQPDEDEVAFAQRAFGVLRKGLSHYEGADVEHVASKVVEAGKSDFAGLTAVYVAVLRANGIPARALFGFPVIFEGRPNKNYWPHAKAEFYAPGVGWVPADLAGAIRMNRPGEGLDYFGTDRADFLIAHVDTDLIIDTYFGRKTLECLPDVSWWVIGSGSFDGSRTKFTLSVEVEPVDLDEALAPKTKSSRPAAAASAKGSR
jgi:transglutaminase-like putative cysteine protease